ncbi:MAG: hypothetical protein A2X94_12750 [Bdellovibrionales bacterium GWB1_55_8]|nr:MAG: hypothetical protein A2X94_12750 [Bdellovibrionales bacterium GWB1_55_8]
MGFIDKMKVLIGAQESENADHAQEESEKEEKDKDVMTKVLKKGRAMRIIFFYPGEEGTYVENADVTLYENGIVHIRSSQEETTAHLQNCEILWRFEVDGEDRVNKVRLLKPRGPGQSESVEVESGGKNNPDKSR